MFKSVYEELKFNKLSIETFEDTLYVEKCELSKNIISKHAIKNVSIISGTDGKNWYELPKQNVNYYIRYGG